MMNESTVFKPDSSGWVFGCGVHYVIFVAGKFTFLITFHKFSFECATRRWLPGARGHRGKKRDTQLGPEAAWCRLWAATKIGPAYLASPKVSHPTQPPSNPTGPLRVQGIAFNILFHLQNEGHGPLIMLIFLMNVQESAMRITWWLADSLSWGCRGIFQEALRRGIPGQDQELGGLTLPQPPHFALKKPPWEGALALAAFLPSP